MRETLTHGSVGGAPGNRCFYPDEVTGNPSDAIEEDRIGKVNPLRTYVDLDPVYF